MGLFVFFSLCVNIYSMKTLNALVLAFLFMLAAATPGCVSNRDQVKPAVEPDKKEEVVKPVPKPADEKSPQQERVKDLEAQLAAANKHLEDMKAKGDKIEILTAEKESLLVKMNLAQAYANQWKLNAESYEAQKKDKDRELNQARLDAWKMKLWILSGICGLLSIVAFAMCFGWPLLAPIAKKAGAILGAVALLMLLVAESLGTVAWLLGLVPYILGLGALIAAGFGVYALVQWFEDHNSLNQVVTAVDKVKKQVTGFGEHMEHELDSHVIKHVDKAREKLGIKKPKPKQNIIKTPV